MKSSSVSKRVAANSFAVVGISPSIIKKTKLFRRPPSGLRQTGSRVSISLSIRFAKKIISTTNTPLVGDQTAAKLLSM